MYICLHHVPFSSLLLFTREKIPRHKKHENRDNVIGLRNMIIARKEGRGGKETWNIQVYNTE
jgi:hypothetical protein